jgi:hypothetical protein
MRELLGQAARVSRRSNFFAPAFFYDQSGLPVARRRVFAAISARQPITSRI